VGNEFIKIRFIWFDWRGRPIRKAKAWAMEMPLYKRAWMAFLCENDFIWGI